MPESDSRPRIGWIGTGVMGAPMCGHILAAGYCVTVHSRTRSKASHLLAAGAIWADSPRAVAAESDIVFTMVGAPTDVLDTVTEVIGAIRVGGIIVDMTTSSPALARRLAADADRVPATVLDAPVTGGDVGAKAGTLSIMIGGDANAIAEVTPMLSLLGTTIVAHGGPGTGQHAKAVNQILMASNIVGLAEGLRYAERAGLDPSRVLDSISAGAAGSQAVSSYGLRMIAGDYAPGFAIKHFAKDLRIIAEEIAAMGLPGVLSETALEVYERCERAGRRELGIHGVIDQLRSEVA